LILDNSIRLEAVLGGAVAANQPAFHVDYSTWNTQGVKIRPEPARGALNSTTDVTLLAVATTQGERREIEAAGIYNADTASVTVTVKTDDGTTERNIVRVTLATTESLLYEQERGWYVMQANGAIKQGSGLTGPASSTDNAVVRWDGATGTLTQNSAFVVDDSGHVTSFGGNIGFPGTQVSSAGANTFDDYEEGTWTPVFTFATAGDLSVVYSTQVGTYTKVARLVVLQLQIVTSTFTHTTASGDANITGLPFTSLNVTAAGTMGKLRWQGITKANYTEIGTGLGVNSATFSMQASGSAQNFASVTATDMPSAGSVSLLGTHTHFS
jgi:hypothetical protein